MRLDLHATDEQLAQIASAEKRRDLIVNSLFGMLGIGVALFATIGVVYWFHAEHVRRVRLETQGQRIVGTLDNEYTNLTRTKTGEVRYEVSYWFAIGAETYRGSGTIPHRPYSDQATIIYDPVDPNNNKIEGAEPFPSRWAESLTLLAIAYLCSGASYLYRKFKRRKQRKQFVPGIH